MEDTVNTAGGSDADQLIVRADEIDQTGTAISSLPDHDLLSGVASGLPGSGIQDLSEPLLGADGAPRRNDVKSSDSGRPELRRDAAAPPPPMQPPPPAPGQSMTDQPPDSLSLAQLKRIVEDMPKVEQQAYAFEYADCQPFPIELDEWFQYSEPDRMMLLGSKVSFDHHWTGYCKQHSLSSTTPISWLDASHEDRKRFVDEMLEGVTCSDLFVRTEALEALCYVMSGVWGTTAGRSVDDYPEDVTDKEAAETPKHLSLQIKWIEENVMLVHECNGLPIAFEHMTQLFSKERLLAGADLSDGESESDQATRIIAREREVNLLLTCLYLFVEVARRKERLDRSDTSLRDAIASLKPNLLTLLVETIARLRWDESANVPFTRIILLFWKTILLLFGGSESLRAAKEELEPTLDVPDEGRRRLPFLTASPLDYHIFRQEITSKYPAYNPPPPVVPLELENNSILPPLPNHPSRLSSVNGLFSGVGPSTISGSGSILHQSVHIATPAPSPPPSPIGPGGKAGKKQNYQTNQNFPFMYPPLDGSSNKIGGKGSSEQQDELVGKKWEGSDVPASIIEAGRLFSSHVKMTRAIRQLWEEREKFMKFERGWNSEDAKYQVEFNSDGESSKSSLATNDQIEQKKHAPETGNKDIQRRLDAVERFYTEAMPHLQSIVIVLLKVVLANVSAMVNQMNAQNGGSAAANGYGGQNGYTGVQNGGVNHGPVEAAEELDDIRIREITGKAVSGTLLLLLKWFKRSHILKFEYMTQLLLDSNYLPLILKMFAHQDVDQAVAQTNDRDDLSFFHFCHLNSEQPPEHTAPPDDESSHSEDEAVPPPILRHSRSEVFRASSATILGSPGKIGDQGPEYSEVPTRPEVDELGYPTVPLPKTPITTFSFRNFFSAINYLHIMQKITRDKAHRCLLLVQYKSSTILRKGLKIPDPHLRQYTLKLFKSQVPYCGRKWRQSNMRVITAIYLYCRPELRDDWLAGSDVDAEVEEALPLEQALRGLTHWWHLREYKDVMNIEEGASLVEEERDFFARELEAMGWGLVTEDMLNDISGDNRDFDGPGGNGNGGPPMNGSEWEAGPLQMEGW